MGSQSTKGSLIAECPLKSYEEIIKILWLRGMVAGEFLIPQGPLFDEYWPSHGPEVLVFCQKRPHKRVRSVVRSEAVAFCCPKREICPHCCQPCIVAPSWPGKSSHIGWLSIGDEEVLDSFDELF